MSKPRDDISRNLIRKYREQGDWVAYNALIEHRVLHGLPLDEDMRLMDHDTGEYLPIEVEATVLAPFMEMASERTSPIDADESADRVEGEG